MHKTLKKFFPGCRCKSRQAHGLPISLCLRGLPKSAQRDAFHAIQLKDEIEFMYLNCADASVATTTEIKLLLK